MKTGLSLMCAPYCWLGQVLQDAPRPARLGAGPARAGEPFLADLSAETGTRRYSFSAGSVVARPLRAMLSEGGDWLEHYNTRRPHSGIGNRPPISRVHNLHGQNSQVVGMQGWA